MSWVDITETLAAIWVEKIWGAYKNLSMLTIVSLSTDLTLMQNCGILDNREPEDSTQQLAGKPEFRCTWVGEIIELEGAFGQVANVWPYHKDNQLLLRGFVLW